MSDQLADRIRETKVETLALEGVDPTTIATDAPLLGEGLGLNSIGALELALACHKELGMRTHENGESNRDDYPSVASPVKFINENQAEATTSVS